MIRRITTRPQRVPMVDAGTLEDRTRPSDGATVAPVRFRLTYSGWLARAHDEAAIAAWRRGRNGSQAPR